jgi:hypothetical protein|nr:MAG TPA: hypothetical protein [Caudoviricetes sp.]
MESRMSLYEYSKQLVAKEVPMKQEVLEDKIESILRDCYATGNYYMLLCHDRRDYTIFNMISHNRAKAGIIIEECLKVRGDVLLIDKQPDGAWEIWIRDAETKENFVYYFFNYNEGVVEV